MEKPEKDVTNLKEAFAVEKPRQAASSSSDKRKITKNKKYRDDSLSSPPSLPMKPIEEELIEIHAERVFPLERLESYYTKPKVGLHRAHGRLFDGVSNLKAKYRKHGVYEPRARRSLQKSPTAASSSAPSTSNLPITPEEEETLEWLRCSTDDFGLCNEKWQRTNEQRKQRVHSNEKLSYLQEFPCLKRSRGHALLTADFDRWYPDNEHSLDDKLPLLKSKLLGISTGSSTRSPFVEELKQLAQGLGHMSTSRHRKRATARCTTRTAKINVGNLRRRARRVNSTYEALLRDQNSETSNLALLLLLPHMVGPVHLKRKRISAAEVRQSFISHIEEPTKILEERQKRQARHYFREHSNQVSALTEEYPSVSDQDVLVETNCSPSQELVSQSDLTRNDYLPSAEPLNQTNTMPAGVVTPEKC
ncbi:hypothetical protein MSG28_000811 [Choristoneura fumiferana]|uniref:Uncharacterized protein n=1 Tax=Choristoneura fumiferana TaxID=7141 RepID=A0ACC0K2B8_CHOFU|nr:hypothetical protein MSG28_000811 [Choristoneura fumiferana]